MLSAQIPLIPGRSIQACSSIPIPFRMIRNEPSLKPPGEINMRETVLVVQDLCTLLGRNHSIIMLRSLLDPLSAASISV
jgi:hypothetical protein